MFRGGKQVVVNFKARLFLDSSVRAAEVSQEIKFSIRAGFESGTDVNNMQRRNNGGDFVVRLDNFSYPVCMFTLQRRHQQGRRRSLILISFRLWLAGLTVFPSGHEAIVFPSRSGYEE